MPDEVITAPVQHSGGARAAAVFLSAHALQSHDLSEISKRGPDPSKRGAQSGLRRLRTLVCVAAPQDEELPILMVKSAQSARSRPSGPLDAR